MRCISPRPACLRARFVSATLRFIAACKPPYSIRTGTSPLMMAWSIRSISRPIPEDRVEPARHRVLTGGIYPDPVIQRFRMADHVVVGDDDARRARLSHQVLGLADSLGE